MHAATPWITLNIERPMRSLRAAAGLGQMDAIRVLAAATGRPIVDGTVTTPEQRGQRVQLRKLLVRAEQYGLEVEIRVRRRGST